MKNLTSRFKRNGTLLLLTLMLMVGMVCRIIPLAWAQGTDIIVKNPATGNTNFIFYTNTTSVGTRFNATAWVYNVTDLFAYQVTLNVNDTLLNITRAWRPTWDPQWVFYGQGTVGTAPTLYDFDGDDSRERALVGDSLFFGGTKFTGNGTLAVIEFEIIYAPPIGSVSCSLDINNIDTFLFTAVDGSLIEIPATKTNGYYEYSFVPVPPTASFTYSPPIPIVNETITFDASSSTPDGGAIASYTWNFDDGNTTTTTDPIITHVYTSARIYNVTLIVTNSEGLSGTTWKMIKVSLPIPVVLSVEPTSYVALHRGELLTINVTISNVDARLRLIGVQFRLLYNASLIKVTNVTEGPFLLPFAKYGTYPIIFVEKELIWGSQVLFGDLILPNATGQYEEPFPEGNGTIATITFNVTGLPPGAFPLTLNDTMLIDDSTNVIPHELVHGYFKYPGLQVKITKQPAPSYQRTEIATMEFTIQYPNGTAREGTYFKADDLGTIIVSVYNGTSYVLNMSLTAADFNSTTNEWNVRVLIPWDAPLGNYSLVIQANNIVDKILASGPPANVSSNPFGVKAVPLTVLAIYTDQTVYKLGNYVTIYFTATYPDGTPVTTGEAILTLAKPDGHSIETLTAYYDSANIRFEVKFWLAENEQIGTWMVTLQANGLSDGAKPPNTGPETTLETRIAVVRFTALSITVDVGAIHFSGEIAGFYILTALDGIPINTTTITTTVYKPDGTTTALTATSITTGLYKVTYTIPADLKGTFTLMVQASYIDTTIECQGTSLKSFLVSPTLANWDALLIDIKDEIATIVIPNLGQIKANLTALNITLVGIKSDIAVLNSTLGFIRADLSAINATIVAINGKTVTIQSSLGEIKTTLDSVKGTVTEINGNVATINTTIEEFQTSLGDIQGTATTILYVTAPLSAIAAIVAIVILVLMKKK